MSFTQPFSTSCTVTTNCLAISEPKPQFVHSCVCSMCCNRDVSNFHLFCFKENGIDPIYFNGWHMAPKFERHTSHIPTQKNNSSCLSPGESNCLVDVYVWCNRRLDVGWRRMRAQVQTVRHYFNSEGRRCWHGTRHLRETQNFGSIQSWKFDKICIFSYSFNLIISYQLFIV